MFSAKETLSGILHFLHTNMIVCFLFHEKQYLEEEVLFNTPPLNAALSDESSSDVTTLTAPEAGHPHSGIFQPVSVYKHFY